MSEPPGTIASRRVYSGRVLDLDLDTVRYPDGGSGELEMIRHPGAAAVVPVVRGGADPEILLIRQYRYAAGGFIWEVPAGRLDRAEAPEACARRELLEEAGMHAARFEKLTSIYTTPGFTDERIHLYAAFDLTPGEHRREPDEFLEVVQLPLSRILGLIRTGEVVDGKSIVALLFFARFGLGL